jgi:hypothetical protein
MHLPASLVGGESVSLSEHQRDPKRRDENNRVGDIYSCLRLQADFSVRDYHKTRIKKQEQDEIVLKYLESYLCQCVAGI